MNLPILRPAHFITVVGNPASQAMMAVLCQRLADPDFCRSCPPGVGGQACTILETESFPSLQGPFVGLWDDRWVKGQFRYLLPCHQQQVFPALPNWLLKAKWIVGIHPQASKGMIRNCAEQVAADFVRHFGERTAAGLYPWQDVAMLRNAKLDRPKRERSRRRRESSVL